MADSKKETVVIKRTSTAPWRKKVEDAIAKGKATAKSLRARQEKGEIRGAVVAVGANIAVGAAHRYAAKMKADAILKGRKFEDLDRSEQIAWAQARQKAGLPHIGFLGEAGTYGAATLIAGLATNNKDLKAAGVGLIGSESYLRARGALLIDKEAATRQGGATMSAALAGDSDVAAADDGAGDDSIAGDGDDDDGEIIEGDWFPGGSVVAGELEQGADLEEAIAGMHPEDAMALAGEEDEVLAALLAQANA